MSLSVQLVKYVYSYSPFLIDGEALFFHSTLSAHHDFSLVNYTKLFKCKPGG